MTLTGKLIKITNEKKLLIQLDAPSEKMIQNKIAALQSKETHYNSVPLWIPTGGPTFLVASLDKYDIQNLAKFERMLRWSVEVEGKLVPHCTPVGREGEERCHIDFLLTYIQKKSSSENACIFSIDIHADEESAKAEARILGRQNEKMHAFSNDGFARQERMTALELAIDGEVEEQMMERFNLPVVSLPAPPVLRRHARISPLRPDEPTIDEINQLIANH